MGDFPIQGPLGPHQSPKTARHTPQIYPFSLLCFQTSDVKQPQIPTPATFFFIIKTHPHWGEVISHPGPSVPPPESQSSQKYPSKWCIFRIMFSNHKGDVMHLPIPTPATCFFIISTHPYLGGVISPPRALRAPTKATKQPDISPQRDPYSLSCF